MIDVYGINTCFGIYAISSMHSSAAFLPVQSMCVFSLVFTCGCGPVLRMACMSPLCGPQMLRSI